MMVMVAIGPLRSTQCHVYGMTVRGPNSRWKFDQHCRHLYASTGANSGSGEGLRAVHSFDE